MVFTTALVALCERMMKSFTFNLLFQLLLCHLYSCTFEIYEEQVLTCEENQALSSLEKIPVSGEHANDYYFEIGCTNVTACSEVINIILYHIVL